MVLVEFSIAFQGSKPMADYGRYAKLMEKYRFDSFLAYDDFMYRPCWPILYSAAKHTSRLKIGPCVTHPFFRHPAYTAGNIACLDELTQGRAVFGIGRGAFYEELGVKATKQLTAVKEAIEVVSRFLAEDTRPYNGIVFRIARGVSFRYHPYRKSVPIFVGTWGPRLSQIAGQMREVSEVRIDTLWEPSYVKVISKAIRDGVESVARDPREVGIAVGPQTSVSKDCDAARDAVRKTLPDYLSYPPQWIKTDAQGLDRDEINAVAEAVGKNDYKTAENLISDRTIDSLAAAGTPEDIIRGAERMIRAGVTHISFCHPHGPNLDEAIRLLGEEVIPHLKSLDQSDKR